MPILKIFSFENTLTSKEIEGEEPKDNIKIGLDAVLMHNAERLCAVATVLPNPEVVKVYLEHILKAELTYQSRTMHRDFQLTQYRLEGCATPLIIATAHSDDYEEHVENITFNGKLMMLQCITSQLPECQEKHFYENDETIITNLGTHSANKFQRYLVKEEATFSCKKIENIAPLSPSIPSAFFASSLVGRTKSLPNGGYRNNLF
ncbi:MAG: hypothetical protein WC785_03860 [Tatlockia sp.]|jgi:hypothetical protein